ncbi:MAG: AAA family ATPase [Fibromonadaceae bacterium]|jgi:predicted ABC-type ATPase|nr:AAA family ATPase [Fibromonadaceae bacterium]
MSSIKRLRIFAGPNGSGKTTLYYHLVNAKAFKDYCFINADEIAEKLKKPFDLNSFPLKFSMNEFFDFLNNSTFLPKGTAYISASIAEFLRQKMLINSNSSFAFETVFSHKSKLDEIRKAKKYGYKVYLYVISTEHPNINKKRVQMRKEMGGHFVPLKKIQERYYRSLDNIYEAMLLADKAFFFDNSGKKISFIAQKKDEKLFLVNDFLPYWFNKYILKKIFK